MNKFEELLAEKNKEYGVISEMDANNGGAIGDGQSMDSEMPMEDPSMDASPNPEQGATTEEPEYTKPYKELAVLCYHALTTNYDDVEESLRNKLDNLDPEHVKSDHEGTMILQTIENILEKNVKESVPEDGVMDSQGPAV